MVIKTVLLYTLFLFTPELISKEIIVSAKRLPSPLKKSHNALVITKEQIEKTNASLISEVIRNIPGITIKQTGQTLTSINIRGTNNGHTLILIDGVKVSDPMSIDDSFNIGELSTSGIERIEIIKGSKSALYGSSAIGGVINIITKKDSKKREIFLSHKVGANQSLYNSITYNDKIKKISWSLDAEKKNSNGYSQANKNVNHAAEKDGLNIFSLKSNIFYRPKSKSIFSFNSFIHTSSIDLDRGGGANQDDPNRLVKKRIYQNQLSYQTTLFDGLMENISKLSYNFHKRDDKNLPDSGSFENVAYDFKGKSLNALIQNNLYFNSSNSAVFGIEHENNEGSSNSSSIHKKKIYSYDLFAAHIYDYKKFFIDLGSRFTKYSSEKSYLSYSFAPGIFISKLSTSIKTSYNRGFKSPSIYQKFSSFGNPNLLVERSDSFDIEISFTLNKHIKLQSTYFKIKTKDLIDYNFQSKKYFNEHTSSSRGFENSFSLSFSNYLKFIANYTRLFTKITSTGKQMIGRPSNEYNASINYNPMELLTFIITYSYIGRRDDINSTMPSYSLINTNLNYEINKSIVTSLEINNLLKKNYEEVKGYGTAGRELYLALKWKLL